MSKQKEVDQHYAKRLESLKNAAQEHLENAIVSKDKKLIQIYTKMLYSLEAELNAHKELLARNAV